MFFGRNFVDTKVPPKIASKSYFFFIENYNNVCNFFFVEGNNWLSFWLSVIFSRKGNNGLARNMLLPDWDDVEWHK